MTERKVEVNNDITNEDLEALDNTEFDEKGKATEESTEEVEEVEETEEIEEKTVEEEAEEEVEAEPSPAKKEVELKDVDGETPREKALRYEVTRLKKERRDAQTKNLIPKIENEVNPSDLEELKELGYSDDELNNIGKVIDVLAKIIKKQDTSKWLEYLDQIKKKYNI